MSSTMAITIALAMLSCWAGGYIAGRSRWGGPQVPPLRSGQRYALDDGAVVILRGFPSMGLNARNWSADYAEIALTEWGARRWLRERGAVLVREDER